MGKRNKPVSLEIDFCKGCGDEATMHCEGCIRMHLNEAQNYDEDWRDNHAAFRRS